MQIYTKQRNANIELLRIISMILIMVGHSYVRLSSTSYSEDSSPLSMFLSTMLSSIVTLGVDIFIAISGWFGIRFRKQGLFKYLYHVLFISWSLYGIAKVSRMAEFSLDGVMVSMGLFNGYWFVLGYLGLYIFSPVLNAFIDNASKKDFKIVLLCWLLFQCYVSWLSAWYDYYGGFSIVLFSGIYLTAAYFRKYPIKRLVDNSLKILILTILLMSLIAFLSQKFYGHYGRQIRDDNPLVILASVLLVVCFSKFRFQSKLVNWFAASSFSVYLIHYNPYVYKYFMSLMEMIYNQLEDISFFVTYLLALVLVFLCCVLYDQIRIYSWKVIAKIVHTIRNNNAF